MSTEFQILREGIKTRDEKIVQLKKELRDLQDVLVEHDRAAERMASDIRKQVFESLGIDVTSEETISAGIAAILKARRSAA